MFRRSAAEWRAILPAESRFESHARVYAEVLPVLGVRILALRGALTADEVDLLHRIAAGEASHPLVSAEHARKLAAETAELT